MIFNMERKMCAPVIFFDKDLTIKPQNGNLFKADNNSAQNMKRKEARAQWQSDLQLLWQAATGLQADWQAEAVSLQEITS